MDNMNITLNLGKEFIKQVASHLRYLLENVADPKNPYVAILYSTKKDNDLNTHGKIVASACNTEEISGNSNSHAEINILTMASKLLHNTRADSEGNYISIKDREYEFFLFVNTRSCPKCTQAILDAQIFNVIFMYDNDYMKKISEELILEKNNYIEKKECKNGTYFHFCTINYPEIQKEFEKLTNELKSQGELSFSIFRNRKKLLAKYKCKRYHAPTVRK